MSNFKIYLMKRLGYSFITLWAISLIVFFVTQVLPGNAATMLLGQFATPERIEVLEQQLGLNEPLHVQYYLWLRGILQGDLGVSLLTGEPIVQRIYHPLIRSLQLVTVTLIIILLTSIPLGVLAAVKDDSVSGLIIRIVTYLGISVPEFIAGALLIFLFAGPVFNIAPSGGHYPMSEGIIPWWQHIILPALTLAILIMAHSMRQTRTGMLAALNSDYVRTARLKGLNERQVVIKHALRNGLLETITVLALNIGWLLGGIVVVEELFAYQGIGRVVVSAISNRDIPLVQASILIISAGYVFANLAADLLYAYLDPRIDYGGSER